MLFGCVMSDSVVCEREENFAYSRTCSLKIIIFKCSETKINFQIYSEKDKPYPWTVISGSYYGVDSVNEQQKYYEWIKYIKKEERKKTRERTTDSMCEGFARHRLVSHLLHLFVGQTANWLCASTQSCLEFQNDRNDSTWALQLASNWNRNLINYFFFCKSLSNREADIMWKKVRKYAK